MPIKFGRRNQRDHKHSIRDRALALKETSAGLGCSNEDIRP